MAQKDTRDKEKLKIITKKRKFSLESYKCGKDHSVRECPDVTKDEASELIKSNSEKERNLVNKRVCQTTGKWL